MVGVDGLGGVAGGDDVSLHGAEDNESVISALRIADGDLSAGGLENESGNDEQPQYRAFSFEPHVSLDAWQRVGKGRTSEFATGPQRPCIFSI